MNHSHRFGDNPRPRRHDLDALRALAMLLGILLHAMMSFVPGLWPVQDANASPGLGILLILIHGFRMPLFFLVSGFFTALLWRQRGLKALIRHRILRILVPCLLGLLTIVPLYRWVAAKAEAPPSVSVVPQVAQTLTDAAQQGNSEQVRRFLAAGADPNAPDSKFGVTPLSWAAMHGQVELVQLLIEKGAKPNQPNKDGSFPLHCAAFLGQDAAVRVLLQSGADVTARTQRGYTPTQVTYSDRTVTQPLIGQLGLPARSQESIAAGQERCRALLPAPAPQAKTAWETLRARYGVFLRAPWFATPVFEHLWFLWFLCWLLPFFVIWTRLPERKTRLRPLWLAPFALLPQLLMGTNMPSFGPDTATGLVPPPHLLAYYGVFFFFGVLSYEADDTEGVLERRWKLTLSLALSLVLPLGLVTMTLAPALSSLFQVLYAWLMIFGLLGLARHRLSRQSPRLRYLADASYWLYVAHLPLVVAFQILVRDSALPVPVKLLVILASSLTVLLTSYQFVVRPLQPFLRRLWSKEGKRTKTNT